MLLAEVETQTRLANRLRLIANVSTYDDDESEAERLAHALAHLEESFSRFTHELLSPLLKAGATDEQLDNALHDIGEEIRHISYHLQDPRYFRVFLTEPS